MDQAANLPENDLFRGIDSFINTALGVVDYRTRTAALALNRLDSLDGETFVAELFQRFSVNWDGLLALQPRGSAQNFRWHRPQLTLSAHNTSPEVSLERALMRACAAMGRTDWSNQVPIVSGIAGSTAGKRRAIDLVCKRGDGWFEFVELKVASNTPVFAAMEVLQYGLLWLLSRRDRHLLGYAGREMIEAGAIDLSVLAPRRFFTPFPCQTLSMAIAQGLSVLGNRLGVALRYNQFAFESSFAWPQSLADHELVALLDRRERV